MRDELSTFRFTDSCGLALAGLLLAASAATGGAFEGRIVDDDQAPVVGAMVTAERGSPARGVTVFSDASGYFRLPELDSGHFELRVRRIGWRDHRSGLTLPAEPLAIVLERETDPAAVAAQLPANRWFGLFLEQIDDPVEREEFVRQCTYCHQQGSLAMRVPREDWQWEKILVLMARMGGVLSPEVRAQVPDWFRAAYDPETAVPRLTHGMGTATFAPPPPPDVRVAVIDEWVLGGRSSMQHDLVVHPSGHVYSVDMMQDTLFRLDPQTGAIASFEIPDQGLPLGGELATAGSPMPPNANAHVGPHSLQVAPDGSIWTTLALGNRLGRFDPESETWSIHRMTEGIYPHTLRIDESGRIWFTIAVSNHLGRFDPASNSFDTIRLPAGTWTQALVLRLLPAMLWMAEYFELGSDAAGEGALSLPVPYGIDIAPDGDVWFSQLNQHKIGRVDPDTLEVELIDTPFTAPRRLRFDSTGQLWIPGFSSGLIARFDPATRTFQTWPLPQRPRGSETPYALHVDRRTDTVWICGTNSDTLIRFEPQTERFSVFPLPTRVTYTREIDFDAAGR
ncbi:MAG: carboxypeptidase regulatory-like domain-containing protein, partial [Deltaproteobacteria bacterium]|nr:carboxypeptidase regulatory-like domain-containing protein [Deltaproteobacteria bacterium]